MVTALRITTKEIENKLGLIEALEQAKNERRLNKTMLTVKEVIDGKEVPVDKEVYLLLNDKHVALDCNTGEFLYTSAGKGKSNNRQYVNIPIENNDKYMCAAYTFAVICRGLFEETPDNVQALDMYKNGVQENRAYNKKECDCLGYTYTSNENKATRGPVITEVVINHINGNSRDNRNSNLELDSLGMNNAHARLMSEIHYYFPHLVSKALDCQGHAMHTYICTPISCKDIRRWNKENPDCIIKAWKDKKGNFTPRLTKEQVTSILNFFGIKY